MKKGTATFIAAAAITISMGSTAFAAGWQQDAAGWWWQEDNGSYPINTWKWIDGNFDGVAECYYFNESGYCLQNTVTPDMNTVNAQGAWMVNGIVQVQSTQPPVQEQQTSQAAGTALDIEGTYKGIVDGNVEYAIVENINGQYFMELTWWGKDYVPYIGGGVFEDSQIRLVFNGNVMTFSYVHGGQSYQLTKQ